MGIYNLVISWKKWVKSKKILNENEKFKIPKEYLINNKDDDLDDFDKEIKKFEKMI
jgi:hypothetical protein